MTRVVLAPCSPFSVTPDLMRESAALAAPMVCGCTHIWPRPLRKKHSVWRRLACAPCPYVESLGWTGDDVWHAHCVHMSAGEIDLFGRTRTGVAHCPSSNMRLASGICRVLDLRRAGAPVGWASTDRPPTTRAICWPRRARPCCCKRVAPDRYQSERRAAGAGFAGHAAALSAARRWRSPRAAAAVLGRDDVGYLAPA